MSKMTNDEIPAFPPHRMSFFTLIMVNIAAMVALINLPSSATYGLSAIFYYLFAAIVFLLPVALVSAELATGWAKHGGVYIWVKEALGSHWGFLAIFLQWIQIVFFYPTILTFAAIAFVFSFNSSIATSTTFLTKVYIYLFILVVFWSATFLNFQGMKLSSKLSTIGVVFGILIPGAFLIILGGLSVLLGNVSETPLKVSALIPTLDKDHIIFALGIFLTFAGLEMSSSHAEEVHNPQKNYPIAIFITLLIVVFLMTAGSVAISIVVPGSDLKLSAGLMQAFNDFLVTFNVPWLLPVISLLLISGVIGLIATWIVGPTKGLLAVSRHGFLPPFFQKINKNHIPTTILIIQAVLVSIVSLMIFIAPAIDTAFWILSALAIQSYLIMYILLFITGIRLRYTEPNVHRDFRIPLGKNLGMNLVAGLGLIACIAGFLVGFVPPDFLGVTDTTAYALELLVTIIIVCAIPLSIYYLRRPSWDTDPEDKVNKAKLPPQTL